MRRWVLRLENLWMRHLHRPNTACPACGHGQLRYEGNNPKYHLFGCPACGLVFVARRVRCPAIHQNLVRGIRDMYEMSVQEHYDTVCSGWDRSIPDIQDHINRDREAFALQLGLEEQEESLGSDRSMLEVGCADGFVLDLFARRGWRVQGLELNVQLAEAARQRGYEVVGGKVLEEAGLAKASFDLIVMYHLIEHVEDVNRFVDEVAGLLKPRGRVIIETPAIPDLYDVYHLYFFTPGSLRKLVERHGFREVGHHLHEYVSNDRYMKDVILYAEKQG